MQPNKGAHVWFLGVADDVYVNNALILIKLP